MPDLLERLKSALGDRYAVESQIGRGGMATVFLAEDLKHHRQVAIKVPHPELAAAVGPDRFLREEAYDRAMSLVIRALELDLNLAEAHFTLAVLREKAHDWDSAEQAYRRATELGYALANASFGDMLATVGRSEEVIQESRRAVELNPRSRFERWLLACSITA